MGAAAAAATAAAASYMVFEAQWPRCRQAELAVPGLPGAWSGVTVLHLSDVHAGLFATNELSLAKVVRWAAPLEPDLVVLTGDVLGDPERSSHSLKLLAELRPPLGMFAVTGNHEYGLGKGPLAKARNARDLWSQAGAMLLTDRCVDLPPRDGVGLTLCGADYLSAGFGLLDPVEPASDCGVEETAGHRLRLASELASEPASGRASGENALFRILLIHEPPPPDSPLASLFPLAFAGHTHGGQLRLPGPTGLTPVVGEEGEFLSGVYRWGEGRLVVSRGVGTSFLPFRLLTRPEATLWRLV